jgi:transcriptional regulator with XRE-family HTH domain
MPQPRKKPQPPNSPEFNTPGPRIKRVRIKRGLSQADLADLVGVSREAIAAYESGRIRLLDDMIARLAVALSVTSDELLGLKVSPLEDDRSTLRLTSRIKELEKLPEQKRKAILKTLDDLIKANS